MIKALQSLRSGLKSGREFSSLTFWRAQEREPGKVDESCLSQWYPATFEVDGVRYATAEHWMMAAKARLFGVSGAGDRVLTTPSPAKAKQLGRRVRGFDERAWEAQRFETVVRGNHAKFHQNEPLARFLRSTGHCVLAEASPVDRIWGIGLPADHEGAVDPLRWLGTNLLGFALMVVRAELDQGATSLQAYKSQR